MNSIEELGGQWVEAPITVRFGDTDPYGVVYFASYFRYCHHGIEEFFRTLGFQPQKLFRNQEEGYGLPIVGATCDFLRPFKYGDRLRLAVSIMRLLRRKLLHLGFIFIPLMAVNLWPVARQPLWLLTRLGGLELCLKPCARL